jgi:uncharacterized membrane protein YedE/YeeE
MFEPNWIIIGGFLAGALAGAAARFGKLCTMSAIEDALVARDFRGLKAWGLALAVAIVATQAGSTLGLIDLSRALYLSPRIHLIGTLLGGAMFGLGMTLVGTCGFGLLVRAGGGDLRAGMSALVVGIFAIAATAGLLGPLRMAMLEYGVVDLTAYGGSWLLGVLQRLIGTPIAIALLCLLPAGLLSAAFADRRIRQRPRLVIGALFMGLSIAAGWFATSRAVDALLIDRPESLSFVAPMGRALLQFMADPFRNTGFGVAAMFGVLAASFAVAWLRDELRSEAFDDATEMRRHMLGGALMGIGGVLAQGCTIGQGLSAASTLAVTAPLFIASVFLGAKLGLLHLIEGRSLWRLGRSQRFD